jgi:predicted RNA-binding protein YlxR (DUF448 family)
VRNKEVILLAQKKNALSQALNIEVDQVIYEKLLEEVND